MTFDVALFRTNFPEFRDVARYPSEQIAFWGAIAILMVNSCYWQTMTVFGTQLYVAHEMTLAAQNVRAAENGGVPGSTSGPTNSKTVGSVTVAYDTTQTAEKNAGWWNLTTYGKQFFRLSRIFGAGCVQL